MFCWILLVTLLAPILGAIICVDNCNGVDQVGCGINICCNSISYALRNLSPGYTLQLEPGIYSGELNTNLHINIQNIKINSSRGPDETIISLALGINSNFISSITVPNFKLEGITMSGATNYVIAINATAQYVEVSNCRFGNSSVFIDVGDFLPGCLGIYHNSSGSLVVSDTTFHNITFKTFSQICSLRGIAVVTQGNLAMANCVFSSIISGEETFNGD